MKAGLEGNYRRSGNTQTSLRLPIWADLLTSATCVPSPLPRAWANSTNTWYMTDYRRTWRTTNTSQTLCVAFAPVSQHRTSFFKRKKSFWVISAANTRAPFSHFTSKAHLTMSPIKLYSKARNPPAAERKYTLYARLSHQLHGHNWPGTPPHCNVKNPA